MRQLLLAAICTLLVGGGVDVYRPPVRPAAAPDPFHLPTHCRPLMGTGEWADCMGVGVK